VQPPATCSTGVDPQNPTPTYIDVGGANGLSAPERIRRYHYVLWAERYGQPYPQEPTEDDAAARGLLDYRERNRIATPLEEWVPRILAIYYQLDDEWLRGKSYALRFLPAKLPQVVAAMGGSP